MLFRTNFNLPDLYLRVSDASGELEVKEVEEKPLKREHLDSEVSTFLYTLNNVALTLKFT